jgi:hypothetical protein
MTNGTGAAGLAGAAIGISFLGIGLGVTGQVVRQTSRQLGVKVPKLKPQKVRLKRARII